MRSEGHRCHSPESGREPKIAFIIVLALLNDSYEAKVLIKLVELKAEYLK